MSQIRVSNLTFAYEGSPYDVLKNVSFNIDTDWKLGLIGRNGKGKTTLCNLFLGKYSYQGSIISSVHFDYFPFKVNETDLEKTADELISIWKPQVESWQVLIQMNEIKMDPECLYRPFKTLSHGERTRVMLAALFAGENEFLLIDEPTNHLDIKARKIVKEYLAKKKGFILISHDRDLLDAVCDHVLVFNKATVEVQTGNFSSWWDNKQKKDAFSTAENEKHLKEIGKLRESIKRSRSWADKNENTKIGFDPVKEHDRCISTRAVIGAKTKKMQSRVQSYEKRVDREIEEKEGLLQDIEKVVDLKLNPLVFHKETLIEARDLKLSYEGGKELFDGLTFKVKRGDRIILSGENGCGKSSVIKAIFQVLNEKIADNKETDPDYKEGIKEIKNKDKNKASLIIDGRFLVPSGLIISYINQDTSGLKGKLHDFCIERNIDKSLLLAILRQLDFEREQFDKNMEDFSEGQKKKVLIASSLLTPAHLYIWDEPLNYIDVFSRMQIEKLILQYKPTMLLVEHDVRFQEKIATEIISLK